MYRDEITITTQHGTYPVHRNWLDVPGTTRIWERAGEVKAPKSGPAVIDHNGRAVLPPGVTPEDEPS